MKRKKLDPPKRHRWLPKIEKGRRYRLRNRALVQVDDMLELPYGEGRKRKVYRCWIGHIVGTRQKITWCLDGPYSPIAGARNPLDIVSAVPRSKPAKRR